MYSIVKSRNRISRQPIQNTKQSKGYDEKKKRKIPILIFLVIRHRRDEGIIDIKNPSISAIALKITSLRKIHNTFFNRPLGIDFVLSGSNILANVANTFLGYHTKESNVMKLNVQSPAFTVVLEADFEARFGPLGQNVPV